MGWLNAIIESKGDKSDRPKESRLMRHKANNTPAPFVSLDAGEYLLNILMEAGPVKQAPMGGLVALHWSDLRDYDHFCIDGIEYWEAKLLIQMSEVFVTGMNEGASPFSIPPADRDSAKEV
jgi:hypothetical protein|tara:strand:- start:137 stop:499 length:363 start_codon:yes stop_codon:yes gene_type:complete